MKKAILLLTYLFVFNFLSIAQKLVHLTTDKFEVNSQTKFGATNRNFAEISLPDNTIGYVFRMIVFEDNNNSIGETLLSLLEVMPRKDIQLGAKIGKELLQNNNSKVADFYILSNNIEKENFKNNRNFNCCKIYESRREICSYTNECSMRKAYFGFRNNNLNKKISISFEVVALVEEERPIVIVPQNRERPIINNTPAGYRYHIINDGNVQVNFQLMENELTSRFNYFLYSNHQNTYTFSTNAIVFKLVTTGKGKVKYTIYPNVYYHIKWNEEKLKWDLYSD